MAEAAAVPALVPPSAAAGVAAPVVQQPRTDYKRLFATMETPRLISEYWERTEDPAVRDRIVTTLVQRGEAAWPSGPMATREEMAGLYPDPADPQFAARLFSKREFYEARAVAAAVAEGTVDPCTSAAAEKVFELTPVQRIVSRFMHPLTPYNGMLLFHGVGVGKTCSAVTIAEQFLEYAPNTKVIVLAPQALQDNFKRTVVDPLKFSWDEGSRQWVSRQCTGTSYLDRLGLINNPDLKHVQYKVEEDRRQRYTITGYQAFANWIRRTLEKSVPAGLTDPELREAAENEVLRRLFSDHLIIIDEAHNLREGGGGRARKATAAAAAAPEADEVAADETPSAAEAAENAGGKALNPYLRRIALNTEGMRLVLMTATPMYNSAPEIVHLLNFLILNDTKSERSQLDRKNLFTGAGKLMSDSPAVKTLERVARRYVSYMRGENPYTFPIRMRPAAAAAAPADEWPALSATRRPIQLDEVRGALNAMPLVFTDAAAGSPAERLLRGATRGAGAGAAAEGGEEEGAEPAEPIITDAMLDFRMQMANITYPNDMYGVAGWDEFFQAGTVDDAGRRLRVFSPRDQGDGPFDVDTVFTGEGLRVHGPKIHRIVESVKAAQGICFVYSRYIKAGALPLAIALERAGFQRRMPDGRIVSLLAGVAPVAPVCALCGRRRGGEHEGQPHAFAPATYVLLTSEADISPNFAGLVRQAASWPADPENGPLGTNVKVVIGSQVASEGLDLKCIREMHVLDAWYHLNRTDQIIGRAIRYCSHTALRAVEARLGLPAMSMNNCLIYLHALRVPDTELGPAFETADMYAYRIAIEKALMVGEVQRLLKKHAWDCNLELEAITFTGLPAREQIDAQGRRFFGSAEEGDNPKYSIDDVDFTTYCDYQRCAHECALTVARTVEEGLHLNSSTYSATDARRQVVKLQDIVRHLFDEQVVVPETVVQEIFGDLPWEISSEALMELIDGRKFRLRRPDGTEGFLVKKAGYLVFQPAAIRDTEIPITLRYARAFQLQRQFLTPQLPVFSRIAPVVVEESATARPPPALMPASAAAPAAAGGAGAGAAPTEEPAAAAAAGAGAFVDIENLLHQWAEWVNYIETAGAGGLPRFLSSTVTIWGWIMRRYATVPQARMVAFRWFFDRLTYDQQRGLYEYIIMRPPSASAAAAADPAEALAAVLAPDIFRSKQMIAYRIYNPDVAVMGIETWCRPLAAPSTEPFRPCSSTIGPLVNKQLGDKPVPIPAGVGTLFGFIAAKKGRTVFKTLDTTKAGKLGGGAECGNTSNLGEHRPRIRLLHEAGRSVAELEPLMLPDSEDGYDTGGARKRAEAGAYEHLNDITHQPLCMYMEFLCRLLDLQRVGGRRWYLSAVEAAQSGLKGKK